MASEEIPPPRWAYSDAEWQTILSIAPEADHLRGSLEWAANDLLSLPTSADVRVEMTSEYDFQHRLNKAAAALLSVLNEIEEGGDRRLRKKLIDTLDYSQQAMDELREEMPHSNKLNGWGEYLWQVCLFGHRCLKLPTRQRRRPDGTPYGPLVEFVLATAGPVKKQKGPYNLSGPMTAEMAHWAIRDYARYVDDEADVRARAVIMAAMAEDRS